MTRLATSLSAALTLLGSLALSLAPAAASETVLVPLVYYEARPGRNGALWKTEFTIVNANDQPWNGVWPHCWPTSDNTVISVPAHGLTKNEICTPVPSQGEPRLEAVVLAIPDELSSLVSFQLRVRDVNASATNAGCEVPVVRTGDFLAGRSELVDIPGTADFLRTVRIYNLSPSSHLEFTMRGFLLNDPYGSEPVLEVSRVVSPLRGSTPGQLRLTEGIDLPSDRFYDPMRFELIPSDPSIEYWWFVSVSSESTSSITIISPH